MTLVLLWLALVVVILALFHFLRHRAPPERIPRVRYLGWSGSMWRERK